MPVAVFCVAAVFTHRSHRSRSAPGMGAQRHLPALILGAGYLGWFIPLLSFPPGDLPFFFLCVLLLSEPEWSSQAIDALLCPWAFPISKQW